MSRCHPFGLVTFSGLSTGKSRPMGMAGFAVAALPTDPIGAFALTLTNLVIGSALQVESSDGQTLFFGTVSSADTTVPLQTYAAGSPLNSLTIKVRKGSEAPYYQPFRTQTTAIVGAQSIYVSQIEDQ